MGDLEDIQSYCYVRQIETYITCLWDVYVWAIWKHISVKCNCKCAHPIRFAHINHLQSALKCLKYIYIWKLWSILRTVGLLNPSGCLVIVIGSCPQSFHFGMFDSSPTQQSSGSYLKGPNRLEMILPLIHLYGISQLSMFDYGRVVRNTAYCWSVCLPAALQSVLGHCYWLDLRFRCRDCRFVASAPTTVCCTPIVVCCIPMFLSYIYIYRCTFLFIVINMYL
jgi:hypothetical protein